MCPRFAFLLITRIACAVPKPCAESDLLLYVGARAHPSRLPVHGPDVRLAGALGAERCRQGCGDPRAAAPDSAAGRLQGQPGVMRNGASLAG
jgi:hypothetical protein